MTPTGDSDKITPKTGNASSSGPSRRPGAFQLDDEPRATASAPATVSIERRSPAPSTAPWS